MKKKKKQERDEDNLRAMNLLFYWEQRPLNSLNYVLFLMRLCSNNWKKEKKRPG